MARLASQNPHALRSPSLRLTDADTPELRAPQLHRINKPEESPTVPLHTPCMAAACCIVERPQQLPVLRSHLPNVARLSDTSNMPQMTSGFLFGPLHCLKGGFGLGNLLVAECSESILE